MGEMLEAAWEEHATALANCTDDQVDHVLQVLINSNIPKFV